MMGERPTHGMDLFAYLSDWYLRKYFLRSENPAWQAGLTQVAAMRLSLILPE